MGLIIWLNILAYLLVVNSTTVLYHLQITQSNQAFTVTFDKAFKNFPIFTCFIESGVIQNNEFSLTYDRQNTFLTNTQITIHFITYKASAFSGESLNVALLVTDSWSSQFQIGVKVVNIAPQITFDFGNLTLLYQNTSRGIIEVYSLCYPLVYSSTPNTSFTNKLDVTIIQSPSSYQTNVYFSYIYFNSNYLGQNVAALFKEINQTTYGYMIPYWTYAFTPTNDNILFAFRQYSSTSIPFLNCQHMTDFTFPGGVIIGYSFSSGSPAKFFSDVFFFNSSFSGCPSSQFLQSLILYRSLPFSCIPCHPTCLRCATSSESAPSQTDANSCLACTWLGYLNATSDGTGNCICLPGINQVNGICQQCLQACLTFTVEYIQTTNLSNFLLTYSYANVVELIQLQQNLVVYLNGLQIYYNIAQAQSCFYTLTVSLQDMKVCEQATCQFEFIMQSPSDILKPNMIQSLCMNNVTLQIENYIDYYSLVPSSLQGAFNVLGIIIGMAFAGGASSLVTILFELEQLIDAHRYLKLTLPVVFNELLYNMLYFRFLSILNLLPYSYTQTIQDIVPRDLDNLGPPKLRYYESGLNLYKNSITGFISVVGLLFINLVIYYILKLIPLKATKKLAKKISVRKFITIHDTLEQLQLPFFYYSLQQLQIVLSKPNLYWIYGMAIVISGIIIAFPFLIVMYIYNNKNDKAKIQIYEDLMQDNKMNQKVTYIYYLFNYYRKIFFAMFVLSIFPGLVQIYLLIILNCLHLAFQVYLVVARTYKSKMKIVIRFINDICIIIIEVLILLYNLNNYQKKVMINIGMSCLYLAVVTTIMGIIDVIVKVIDTCQQELSSKSKEKQEQGLKKVVIGKEYKVQIGCKIGDELPQMPKDPKEIKFMEDKQLMENTFDKQNESDNMSVHLHNYNQESSNGDLDLVYIEDDDVAPEPISFRPHLNQNNQFVKKQKEVKYDDVELYEIPKDIDRQAQKINQNRRFKKNKYILNQQQREETQQTYKSKEEKPKSKTNTLVIKETRGKQQSSESNDIEDIISRQ